jgi:hypothetical protein
MDDLATMRFKIKKVAVKASTITIPGTHDAFMYLNQLNLLVPSIQDSKSFIIIDKLSICTFDEYYLKTTEAIIKMNVPVSPKLKETLIPIHEQAKSVFESLSSETKKWVLEHPHIFS